MQANWIGKSQGAVFEFKVVEKDINIPVYTTRPDTVHGITYLVVAPEYKDIELLTTPENKDGRYPPAPWPFAAWRTPQVP